MRTTRSLAAAGLALLLAGLALAQPKPQEAILGRWESTEKSSDVIMAAAELYAILSNKIAPRSAFSASALAGNPRSMSGSIVAIYWSVSVTNRFKLW